MAERYGAYASGADYRPGRLEVPGLQESDDMDTETSGDLGQSEPSAASVFSDFSSPRWPVTSRSALETGPQHRSADIEDRNATVASAGKV